MGDFNCNQWVEFRMSIFCYRALSAMLRLSI